MKTSKYLTLAGAALCLAGVSVPASAATTITSGTTTLNFHTSGNGLLIDATPAAFSFSLNNVMDSVTTTVMTIGTPETALNWDDLAGKTITALFSFASPAGASGLITGTTSGTFNVLGQGACQGWFGSCGQVNWNGPAVVDFGQGGQFKLELSNQAFALGGSSDVQGTFTLLAAAVPEPSTWAMLILGFGAVGFMMRSRRRQNVSVSYA